MFERRGEEPNGCLGILPCDLLLWGSLIGSITVTAPFYIGERFSERHDYLPSGRVLGGEFASH
jgi:hypothetical protein